MSKLKMIWAILRGGSVIYNVEFLSHVTMNAKKPGQTIYVVDCSFKPPLHKEGKLYALKIPGKSA